MLSGPVKRLADRLPDLGESLVGRLPDPVEPLVRVDRIGQFATAGAVGVCVELVVLAALVESALTGRFVGGVLGKEAAVFVMFALNERWTFADQGRPGFRALGRRLLVSNAVRAFGNGVALAVYAILSLWFGLWYLVAALAGIAVGFLFNFLLEGLWTWGR